MMMGVIKLPKSAIGSRIIGNRRINALVPKMYTFYYTPLAGIMTLMANYLFSKSSGRAVTHKLHNFEIVAH